MTAELVRPHYKENEVGQFRGTDLEMKNANFGVSVVLVHLDTGKILVGKEQKSKEKNGRLYCRVGDISIPSETRKKYEHIFENVQAALLEEMYVKDSEILPPDTHISLPNFLYLPGRMPDESTHFVKSGTRLFDTIYNSKPNTQYDPHDPFTENIYDPATRIDYVILGYKGKEDIFNNSEGDLGELQWIEVDQLRRQKNIRDTTRRTLEEVFPPERDTIATIQEHYSMYGENAIPIFTPEFDVHTFLRERQRKFDVTLPDEIIH